MKLTVTFLMMLLIPCLVRAEQIPSPDQAGSEQSSSTASSPRSIDLAHDPMAAQGSLVIIGGGARNHETDVFNRIVTLARDYGSRAKSEPISKPRIAVFPTASGDPQRTSERMTEIFEELGAEPFIVPIGTINMERDYREAVVDSKIVSEVKSAHGVYFAGGDQARITQALLTPDGKHTPVLDAVWDLYQSGGVVSGTSAGAAVMSRIMCRGARYVLNTMVHGVAMGQEVDYGFGLVDPRWYIEQHCLVRGRFARALVIMQSHAVQYGLGVDENTAVVVRGENAEVVGLRGVIVLDVSRAKQDENVKGFNLKNVRLSYLDRGDAINLKSLDITPATEKQGIKVDFAEREPITDTGEQIFMPDILGNTTVLDMMNRLLSSRRGEGIGLAFDGNVARMQSAPGFEFRFYRDKDTFGWVTGSKGQGEHTVANIHLDIRPIEITGPLYK